MCVISSSYFPYTERGTQTQQLVITFPCSLKAWRHLLCFYLWHISFSVLAFTFIFLSKRIPVPHGASINFCMHVKIAHRIRTVMPAYPTEHNSGLNFFWRKFPFLLPTVCQNTNSRKQSSSALSDTCQQLIQHTHPNAMEQHWKTAAIRQLIPGTETFDEQLICSSD